MDTLGISSFIVARIEMKVCQPLQSGLRLMQRFAGKRLLSLS